METILFRSKSKKDMDLPMSLAKKIGVEVCKVSSDDILLDKHSLEYEAKVEQNLGKTIQVGLKSGIAYKEDLEKEMSRWK